MWTVCFAGSDLDLLEESKHPEQAYLPANETPETWATDSYRVRADYYENSLRPALRMGAEAMDSWLECAAENELRSRLLDQCLSIEKRRSRWEEYNQHIAFVAGLLTAILITFAVN